MLSSQSFRLLIVCFLASELVICRFTSMGQAASPTKATDSTSVYDEDVSHLWNRVHATLFVRVGPDEIFYGQDRFEPLLWTQSKHLLEPVSHGRAVTVLDEFLANDGEKLINAPLPRALLQRDLWMVFNWLEGTHRDFAEPNFDTEAMLKAQQQLRRRIVAMIGRLTLTHTEIQNLPDNYQTAANSERFARRFDSGHPDQPYLPAELFKDDGPWLCIGRTDGPTAPQHLRDENPYTNSAFVTFIRLPAGRAATVNYVKQLLNFDPPLLVQNPDRKDRRAFPFMPNPRLPQFPKGTELALVRRALLIDSSHRVVASPLTESVQMRIIRDDVPALTKQVLADSTIFSSEGMQRSSAWQTFHEIRLSRTQLLAGIAGGLRAVAADERDFKTGFNAHMWDEFERPLRGQSFRDRSRPFTVKEQCFFCHSMPGVYSFNSFKGDFRNAMRRKDGDQERPFPMGRLSVSNTEEAAIDRRERHPNWIALRKLLSE
jgi:hypothetical protein